MYTLRNWSVSILLPRWRRIKFFVRGERFTSGVDTQFCHKNFDEFPNRHVGRESMGFMTKLGSIGSCMTVFDRFWAWNNCHQSLHHKLIKKVTLWCYYWYRLTLLTSHLSSLMVSLDRCIVDHSYLVVFWVVGGAWWKATAAAAAYWIW